jgi:hypothetical protein
MMKLCIAKQGSIDGTGLPSFNQHGPDTAESLTLLRLRCVLETKKGKRSEFQTWTVQILNMAEYSYTALIFYRCVVMPSDHLAVKPSQYDSWHISQSNAANKAESESDGEA